MNNDELTPLEKATQSNILLAHAKIDALGILVAGLYLQKGSTSDKFYAQFKRVTDAIAQKYLEKIEGQFPKLAADIDWREKMPEIDQDFLDSLRPGDEPEEPPAA
jgi:hypothetical protein